MDGPFTDLFEFVRTVEAARSLEDLTTRFGTAVAPFGVDLFACTEVARPNRPIQFRPLYGRFAPGWFEHYLAQGYGAIDPAVKALFKTTQAFTWADIEPNDDPRLIRLFGEAREARGRDGVVVPVHGPQGHVHVVLLNGESLDDSPQALPSLRLAALYFAEVGVALAEEAQERATDTPLTDRQIECLAWVAEGKSDWEIGAILGISENTVHRHVEKAKAALGVGTRMQAVIKALRRGWLRLQ